ncbi:acetyltransferase [Escherichia coli]
MSICRCHPRFYQQSIGPSWKSWFVPSAGSAVVAVNERDQPVGFMLLSGQHMDALFIDPDVRGCGVGRMLVEHALSMAPELTTNVNEQNEQAVGFYKKVGFKVTGRSEVDDLGTRIRC